MDNPHQGGQYRYNPDTDQLERIEPDDQPVAPPAKLTKPVLSRVEGPQGIPVKPLKPVADNSEPQP